MKSYYILTSLLFSLLTCSVMGQIDKGLDIIVPEFNLTNTSAQEALEKLHNFPEFKQASKMGFRGIVLPKNFIKVTSKNLLIS